MLKTWCQHTCIISVLCLVLLLPVHAEQIQKPSKVSDIEPVAGAIDSTDVEVPKKGSPKTQELKLQEFEHILDAQADGVSKAVRDEDRKDERCKKLKIGSLWAQEGCIQGNEKICGDLSVGGNVCFHNQCRTGGSGSEDNEGVSGAFFPGAGLLNVCVDLGVDVELRPVSLFVPLPQGCTRPFDNPFRNPRAEVIGCVDVRILEASVSSIKGIVLEAQPPQRTQFAFEFTFAIGYSCFRDPPLITLGYTDKRQGTLLNSNTDLICANAPIPVTLFNVFPRITSIQRDHAIVSVVFFFETALSDVLVETRCLQTLLIQLAELIHSSRITLRLFGRLKETDRC